MKTTLVLAGGFGTRLRSLVSDVPKPLAPVADEPFIVYLINEWIKQGAKDFVFLLHYEAEQIQEVLFDLEKDSKYAAVKFRTVVERRPLGTGGAVMNAVRQLDIKDSFLVVNADTWLDSGLERISQVSPCAIGAVWVPITQRYGSLTFDGPYLSRFEEKASSFGAGYINSGLYHLSPDIFDGYETGINISLEKSIFPKLVATRQLRYAELVSRFIDIGIPEDYLRFCAWINSGRNHDL